MQAAQPFDLSGRVAVVTGGGSGIGLGMAEALVRQGCRVSLWGRNMERLERAAETLGPPDQVATASCDVTDLAAIEAAFAATLARFGRVDGMIANAGVGPSPKPSLERTEAEWAATLATNLQAVAMSFKVAARHMVERAGAGDAFGRLIATSSVSALEATPMNEPYSASKAAVNALVRALAVEFARYKVTANAILPGFIESDMTQGMIANETFVAKVMPRIPARRFGVPADFGGIAAYLMSEASAYQTGQSLVIDGGFSIF